MIKHYLAAPLFALLLAGNANAATQSMTLTGDVVYHVDLDSQTYYSIGDTISFSASWSGDGSRGTRYQDGDDDTAWTGDDVFDRFMYPSDYSTADKVWDATFTGLDSVFNNIRNNLVGNQIPFDFKSTVQSIVTSAEVFYGEIYHFYYNADEASLLGSVVHDNDGNTYTTLYIDVDTRRTTGSQFFDNAVIKLENVQVTMSPVPLPAAAWLFGSGLLGLIGFSKRKKAA